MKERFREVDSVPTPWDEEARGAGPIGDGRSRRKIAALGLVAASLAVSAALVAVIVNRPGPARPTPDASWLVGETQVSCVEQYSPRTLQGRSWAFDGVIAAVEGPADPLSGDPGQTTTMVTFDVGRWFWGGTGEQISLRTSVIPSSAGDVDQSLGARLLVSGEEDFLWSCGFTQPFTETGQGEFEAAAAARSEP